MLRLLACLTLAWKTLLCNHYQQHSVLIIYDPLQVGFMNPFVYWAARKYPHAFTDIVLGNNFPYDNNWNKCPLGYETSVGWYPVTGLGMPRMEVLQKAAVKYIKLQMKYKNWSNKSSGTYIIDCWLYRCIWSHPFYPPFYGHAIDIMILLCQGL
jgi:hypothetical protein